MAFKKDQESCQKRLVDVECAIKSNRPSLDGGGIAYDHFQVQTSLRVR